MQKNATTNVEEKYCTVLNVKDISYALEDNALTAELILERQSTRLRTNENYYH